MIEGLVALGRLHVWVADDGSPDGTGEAVRQAMARYRAGWDQGRGG